VVVDLTRFDSLATSAGLGEHLDHLHSVARPAVDIELFKSLDRVTRHFGKEHKGPKSRFGGSPDLPWGAAWPEHAQGPYAFLAQIDFTEVAEGCGAASSDMQALGLPRDGLLSLFFAHNQSGESFRQPGYIKAWFHRKSTLLETVKPPQAVTFDAGASVRFAPAVDLPASKDQYPGWRIEDELWKKVGALRDQLHARRDFLLGHPTHGRSPGPQWTQLLNVATREDVAAWRWPGGGRLMVFVETARLEKRDFSALIADAG
jgi:uncharacterized protein YwqG